MSRAIAVLLEAVDLSWADPWDSFSSATAKVTEPEALWQPPAYAAEPSDAGMPPGSIRWHVAHVAACKEHYADAIEQRPAPPPDRPERGVGAFADELARAHAVHARFRALVAGLAESDLDATVRGTHTLSRFLQIALRHEIWHAGQIRLVRRLHAQRARAEACP